MSIITKDIWGWWWPKWQRCHFRSTSGLNLSKAGALADVTNLKSNWWWLIGVEMMIFLMKLQFLAILIFPNWQDLNLREITPIESFQKLDWKLKRLLSFCDDDGDRNDFANFWWYNNLEENFATYKTNLIMTIMIIKMILFLFWSSWSSSNMWLAGPKAFGG